ncbi:prohead protease [Pantoea phage vB_PagM_AAM37]|uniref:Prohead protease n=1 Tax=Pantoea phage vB_PagM_AAM37 TaxID=2588093 RepID=A0A513ZYC9_9CAUD|nr:head maturation protease [Pantoea phage vB_PagM_AAM37]QDH45678.1 prohead protease [Pantoea phage vB_PagM_AAM37]
MTIRYDNAPIKARFDEAGYLRDEPIVARTGILVYHQKDGSKRTELRLPEDVFHPESLESFSGQAITIGHGAMVNAKNFKKHGVGTALGAGRQDGENVRVPIIVQDERAVEAARKQKLNQLSVGYKINYLPRPGMYNSETGEVKYDDERNDKAGDQEFIGKEWVHFDGLQTDIRVNHIALVRKARAGAVARLNLDGDEEFDYTDPDKSITEGLNMKTIRLDSGVEVEVDEHVASHIEKLSLTAAEEKTRADSLTQEKSSLQAETDTLKAKVAEIPTLIEQARADAAESLKQRADLESSAAKFGVKIESGMDDLAIKKAVVAKTTKINLDGRDDAYVSTAFDIAVQTVPGIAQQREKVSAPGSRNDSDTGASSASEARQRMREKLLSKGGK